AAQDREVLRRPRDVRRRGQSLRLARGLRVDHAGLPACPARARVRLGCRGVGAGAHDAASADAAGRWLVAHRHARRRLPGQRRHGVAPRAVRAVPAGCALGPVATAARPDLPGVARDAQTRRV
ncbi:MAG: hypothetical protein AVDCRST_MAG53-495, partial [uncultured Solirubrobacteraceae bacterium]